jgi:hypothetical protein
VTVVEKPVSPTPVNSLTGVAPQPAPPPATVLGKPPREPAVVKLPITPWTGKVEFGYDNFVSNDVRSVSTTFRAEAERTSRKDAFLFAAKFFYSLSNGLLAAEQRNAEARWRHDLSVRFFTQSDNTYDSDELRKIRYNYQENQDVGYKVFTTVRQAVDVGVGVTGQELDAIGIEQGFNFLGNVFQDYTYRIHGRYTLKEDFSARYSPVQRERFGFVGDTAVPETGTERDYDYKFHTTLQGKISKHLSLNIHFEYEFENAVLDPNARGSQRITTTLGYGF